MKPKKYPYTGSKIKKVTTTGIGARELVVFPNVAFRKDLLKHIFSVVKSMTTLQSFTSEFQKYSDTRRKEQKYI